MVLNIFESMKLWPLLLSVPLLLIGFAACKKNKNSVIPRISFISLEPDSVHSGNLEEKTSLFFGFSDGDGDLGNDPTSGKYDVYLKDSRDDMISRYLFPPIPDEQRDPVNGVEGQGVITLRAIYIVTRQDTLHKRHGDTLTYKMWVVDQADHVSDTITTRPLYIR
jgi:hypothetical protein